MQHDYSHRSIPYEDTTLTLMLCVLVVAMTLLIVGGILVTQVESFL